MFDQLVEYFWQLYDRVRSTMEGLNPFEWGVLVFAGFRPLGDRTRSMVEAVNRLQWIVFIFAVMVVEAMFIIVIGMSIQGHEGWDWKLSS